MKKAVKTESAPEAIGPYSQAVVANGLLFMSGQLPIDPRSGKLVEGGIVASAEQVLRNMKAILEQEGVGLEAVVRVDIFLKDLTHFSVVNDVYQTLFEGGVFPARQTVEVAELPMGAQLEMSCIAVVKD